MDSPYVPTLTDANSADWLRALQSQHGITYAEDDAKPRLRALFEQMVHGIPDGASWEVTGVQYYGFTSQAQPGGDERRQSLWQLHGTVYLGDGTTYGMTLIGPYGRVVPEPQGGQP